MKDILLENDKLKIANGDFVIGESDMQNLQLLIRLSQGAIKQHPLVGFGEERLLNGVLDGRARRDIQVAVAADGYKINTFEILDDKQINIRI
jgi:hypothetical protein